MKNVNAMLLLATAFGVCGPVSQAQFAASQAQFAASLRWVPNDANMITLVRSADLFKSELAEAQKWRSQSQSSFAAGFASVPPYSETVLIAAQMDLELMKRNWEVSVVESLMATDLVKMSKSTGGNLGMLDNNQALLLPTDAFLVRVGDKTIASMAPANRQVAVRWLQQSKRSVPTLSDYLTSTIRMADPNVEILTALDFEHVITPDKAKKKLQDSGIFTDAEIEQVSQLLSEMQGITLRITVTDSIEGVIGIDFLNSPEPLAEKSKPLLIHALESHGLMIDDIQEWHSSVNDNQILLRGSLSTAGMRRIGMLIQQPLPSDGSSDADDTVAPGTRSIQYFTTIESLVNEVRHKQQPTARSYNRSIAVYGKWFSNYARQIDDLSTLGVDQDLLDYGQYVSAGLRDITSILASDYVQVAAGRRYGGYRAATASNYVNYGDQVRARGDSQSTYMASKTPIEAMNAIDNRTAEVRKTLQEKYKVEF